MRRTWRKSLFLFLLVLCSKSLCFSQLPDFTLQFSGAYHSDIRVGNVSMHKTLLNPLSDRLFLDLGVRASAFQASNIEYSTADAELRKDDKNKDLLLVESSLHGSISLFFNAEYGITDRLRVGISFDVLGYSFGPEIEGSFKPGSEAITQGQIEQDGVSAKPLEKNVFLFGNPIEGSLNTQLFARFVPANRFSIYGGISYNHSQYNTLQAFGVNDHSEFRFQAVLPFVGLAFNFYDKVDSE